MRADPDYYGILGVSPSATAGELRAAYLDLVKQHHPDRYRTYVQKLVATRRLQEINAAYAALRDRARRAAYDARRTSRHEPPRSTHTRPARRPGRLDTFFMNDRFRWWRRGAGLALFALGWTLAFLWTSQPPGPTAMVGPDHWIHALPIRILMSAILGPMILAFGFSIVFAYVFMAAMAVMVVVTWFQEAWARAAKRRVKLRDELAARLIMLAGASLAYLGLKVQPELLGLVLTMIGWLFMMALPAAIIDTVALLAYQVWSRRVVTATEALVRV